jgi:N-acetylglucosamine-6-phosphate deacetylase
MEKIIQNVKIINFDNVINNADIEILNGKIKKIIPKKGKSKFIIIPGFVDLHIHGSLNKDVMEGKKSIEFISKYIVKFGTTSFLPTLMTASKNKILNSLKESSKAISIGSKIIGLHIEGP